MHTSLSPVHGDADARGVRRSDQPWLSRARRLQFAVAAGACLLAGALPAVSLAADELAAQQGSALDLAPVESVPDAPASVDPRLGGDAASTDAAADTFATAADVEAELADDLDGTLRELRLTRDGLVVERDALQVQLLELEVVRERAEQRLDRATEAIASQLVALFRDGQSARLQALIEVRDATDPELRSGLVAALAAPEQAIVREHEAASNAAASTGGAADDVRLDVLALGTRIAAIEAGIDERAAPGGARLDRNGNASFSFDADLVFATGPIPGIGYWGDVAGGSALDGWMGFAGAAVGGVGCEPPDPTLVATGQIEQGEASWYGPGFHGNGTANGETYDQTAMTAAHKTLPFGTIVRVYSSVTARCAFVRINDRGPYIDGRIIDLSRTAADQIGMESIASVQVEVWAAPGGAPVSTVS